MVGLYTCLHNVEVKVEVEPRPYFEVAVKNTSLTHPKKVILKKNLSFSFG